MCLKRRGTTQNGGPFSRRISDPFELVAESNPIARPILHRSALNLTSSWSVYLTMSPKDLRIIDSKVRSIKVPTQGLTASLSWVLRSCDDQRCSLRESLHGYCA